MSGIRIAIIGFGVLVMALAVTLGIMGTLDQDDCQQVGGVQPFFRLVFPAIYVEEEGCVKYTEKFSVFLEDYAFNLSSELIGMAITILIIDTIYERRNDELEKRDLVLQAGSPSNAFALQAVRALRSRKWLGKKSGVLRKADLQNADLKGADLSGANLCGANLQGADLDGANLIGADLRKVEFHLAVLKEADLSWADLTGANLTSADLRGANLSHAIYTEEQLRKTDSFAGATLRDGSGAQQ